jgi:EAL domain-containing protein (putative c-di-GMP-specific phosphodiesterase class I)
MMLDANLARTPNALPRHGAVPSGDPTRAAMLRLMESGSLCVVFQPIVDLSTSEVWAYEALGRASSLPPELAHVGSSPAALLDVACESGCLLALDRCWHRLAVEAMASWHGRVRVSLNIDPRVADDPGFTPGFTQALIMAAGLAPSRFMLELTEMHGQNADLIERVLVHYATQGFLVGLDDVGAGAQSLDRVLRLRPAVLKLDRSLVHGMNGDPARLHLVRALVELATYIGARVVAEGIETRDDLVASVRVGAHYGQGWFLARPEAVPGPVRSEAVTVIVGPKAQGIAWSRGERRPLLHLVEGLAESPDLDSALQFVTDCTAVLLRTERVSLRLLDARREGLLVAARTGPSVHEDDATHFAVGEGLIGRVVSENRSLRVGSAMQEPCFVRKPGAREAIGSFLGAPLRDLHGCFGVIATTAVERDAFDAEDEEILRLVAGFAAPHLEARRLARLLEGPGQKMKKPEN